MTFNSIPMNIKTLPPKERFPAISAFIFRLFLEHSEIEHCYFLYQLVLIDMCTYIIYFTLFYFMLHRVPIDTSLVPEGVTLFKYRLLLLLLLLIYK